MLLMKNMPLDMQQRFMALSYELANFSFNDRCDMSQEYFVRCVDTYVPRSYIVDLLVNIFFNKTFVECIIEFLYRPSISQT